MLAGAQSTLRRLKKLGIDPDVDLGLLLDVARDAAQAGESLAGPLTTFLVASTSPPGRPGRKRCGSRSAGPPPGSKPPQ
ncbi:DUF6457 domain-containing protein [Nonomuraea sp. NPDC052116]|uniref:DUF6457 domain-containing protein n=1 Tax=Nonomuraea sp. NPDC052116 TaxID=3155665 RepID=UPI003434D933